MTVPSVSNLNIKCHKPDLLENTLFTLKAWLGTQFIHCWQLNTYPQSCDFMCIIWCRHTYRLQFGLNQNGKNYYFFLSSLPIYFCSGSQRGLEPNPASIGQKIGQKAGKHPGQQCLKWANTHQNRVIVHSDLCTVIFHCITEDQTRVSYWI